MWSRRITALALFVLVISTCSAREVFHLTNGFDLDAKSHAVQAGRFTLTTETGTIEIPSTEIAGMDLVPDPPIASPPSVPEIKNTPAGIGELLRLAALSQGTAPEFIMFVRSVAQVESGLRQGAVSPKGAIGLMQLMPGTARRLRVEPTNAEQNAKGGAQYLRELLVHYNYDSVLALAAYNAGPAAVEKYRGLPPFRETRQYVQRVLRAYDALTAAARKLESSPVR